MNIWKRVIAAVTAIAILLPATIRVEAAAAYTKEALFDRFPQYLNNAESQRRAGELIQSGVDILEATTGVDETYAFLFTMIKDGFSIGVNELFSSGVEQKNYRMELAQAVLTREMTRSGGHVTAGNETILLFQTAADALGVHGDAVAARDILDTLDLAETALGLSEAEKFMIAFEEAMGEDIGVISSGGYVIKTFQWVLAVFLLYELEMQCLDTLLAYTDPQSDLGIGLQILKETRSKSPAEYLIKTWFGTVGFDFLVQAIGEIGEKYYSPVGYVLLIHSCAVFFIEHLYVGPLMDEITLSYLAYANVNSAQVALSQCRLEMMQQGYATDAQSRDYHTLYNAWLSTIEEFLARTASLTTVSEYALKGKALSDMQTLEEGYYLSYDIHLQLCTQQLNKDIAAGKLGADGELPELGAGINAASIADRLAAIQERYAPNAGIAYTQRYGYSYGSGGFARMVFNLLFGVDMPLCTQDSRRFQLYGTENVTELGLLSPSNYTYPNVTALLQQALPGDILIGYGGDRVHYMVVAGTEGNGLVVYDCDSPYAGEYTKNLIRQYTFSYESIFQAFGISSVDGRLPGLALYRCSTRDRVSEGGDAIRYDDSVNFVIEDGVLVAYNGWQSHVVIPEGVIKVGSNAFKNNPTCGAIERVTCPRSLTVIDTYGFYGLSNLLRIDLPVGLAQIGDSAFMSCARLTSLALPDSVGSVGAYAFLGCSDLVAVKLSDGMSELADGVFMDCAALKGVTLPSALQRMGKNAFTRCTALEHIDISGTLSATGYTDYTTGPFNGCSNLRSFTLGSAMTTIPRGLFSYSGLEKVVIPSHVTKIDYGAFQGCSKLVSLDLGSVQTIEQYAFSECTALQTLVVPESVGFMGAIAFAGCSGLISVDLPDTLTNISDGLFRSCTALKSVSLPSSLQTLGRGAFAGCTALEHIDIPGTLSATGYTDYTTGPFNGCSSLRSFTLGSAMTTIPRGLFSYSGLEEVKIPSHITKIDYGAFQGCSKLVSLDLGSVQTIEQYAFSECTALQTLVVPESVGFMGAIAFAGCTQLETVSIYHSGAELADTAFLSCANLTLRGWEGSTTQTYAEAHDIPFAPLGSFVNEAAPVPADAVRINELQYTPAASDTASAVNVTLINQNDAPQTVMAIVAFYSGGKLIAVDTREVSVDGNASSVVALEPDSNEIPEKISIFAVDQGYDPLCGLFSAFLN